MLSDKQLQNYLAGTASPEEAAEIEARIAEDAELEARLFALDFAQAKPLRDAFEAAGNPDTLQALELQVTGNSADKAPQIAFGRIKWVAAAACIGVALVINSLLGQSKPRWQDQVAAYQALYVEQTLAPIAVDDATLTDQLKRGEQALGRSLPLDVVGTLDEIPLLRAQILGFEDSPLIQMAYLTERGVPVALCAIRLEGTPSAEVIYETLSGLPTASWSDGEFSYMIVGNIENEQLAKMAQSLRSTL